LEAEQSYKKWQLEYLNVRGIEFVEFDGVLIPVDFLEGTNYNFRKALFFAQFWWKEVEKHLKKRKKKRYKQTTLKRWMK